MPLAPLHRHEHDALNREVRGLQGISGSLKALRKAPENWYLDASCIVLYRLVVLWLCPHFGTPFSVRFTFFHLFAFVVLKRDEV